MSYHDKQLVRRSPQERAAKGRVLRVVMQGLNDITFFPVTPNIRLGSPADDWRAVGGDIRTAMKKFEKNG